MDQRQHDHAAARAILPEALHAFYVRARAGTYAAGGGRTPTPVVPHSHELRYHDEQSPYFYQDRYFDTPNRPGNFFGIEVISSASFDGPPVLACSYGGGLSDAGMALGEAAVYGVLRPVLREHAVEARFGRRLTVPHDDDMGTWLYEDNGQVAPWGWYGTERIAHNGLVVYELLYSGGCFLSGF